MKQFNVTGMSCAACSARVENAVSKVPGVTSCSVSLLTNSMGVEGKASESEIIKAVENAGYGASAKNTSEKNNSSKADSNFSAEEESLKDKETPRLIKRLIASLVFLLPLLYLSMGHMMWQWPLPAFMEENHIAMGLAQMLLAAIVMVINQKFFVSGFKSVIHGAPNMDTLVALGSSASFVYSTAVLFAMTGAQLVSDEDAVMKYMHEFYFETSAMILTLITVGKTLEAHSKGKTTNALKSLMKLSPQTAVIIQNEKEKIVPIEAVKEGDIFVVRPGENIPVDGLVIEGSSAVNEASITGESIPVDKAVNDTVTSGTANLSGFLKCRATRVGKDTTLSQIIQMVSDAAATKAPIAKVADRVSGIFVPAVISIAILTFIIWFILTKDTGLSLTRAVAVLVISCPCALGLATPVAIMVGNGRGAKNGILFKTAQSLEETGKIKVLALDKTGTITKGEPSVTDILPASGVKEDELLSLAYSLEKKSEHPLAKAIVQFAETKSSVKNNETKESSDFEIFPGKGLSVLVKGEKVFGGNLSFIETKVSVNEETKKLADRLSEKGKTPLFFSKENNLLGIIAVADTIKEDSASAIKEIKGMGIKVVMLTGDNEKTALAIGKEAGVDQVLSGILPEQKEKAIIKLQSEGKVCMVGDGINDAPALTRADIGMAIGAGTDVALDAADLVLMKSTLTDAVNAVKLSRATLRNIHENLFWAFIYNIIGIPLAAGAFTKLFGWSLNPMFGAAAMSLSSFCVVTNALRLNFFKFKKPETNNDSLEEKKMSANEKTIKTVNINGMMCEHCEMHVKKALLSLEGVEDASASHTDKKATVTLKDGASLDQAKVKAAVEDAGYEFVSME